MRERDREREREREWKGKTDRERHTGTDRKNRRIEREKIVKRKDQQREIYRYR